MATLMEEYFMSEKFNKKKFKGLFFEFHLNYLLDQPKSMSRYGFEFFKQKLIKPKTILIHDFSQRESVEKKETLTQEQMLHKVVNRLFILKQISDEDRELVMKYAKRREVYQDEIIIAQDEMYDYFYIIEKGIFDVFVSPPHAYMERQLIYTYKNYGCFGEMAMLSKRKRGASIIARTPGFVWYIDGTVFACYIRKPMIKHRKMITPFLHELPLFSRFEPYDILKLADATAVVECKCGDYIYKQGFFAWGLWFVMEGSVNTIIIDDLLLVSCVIETYHVQDCFGHPELLANSILNTFAVARTDCKVLCIDTDYFNVLPTYIWKRVEKLIPKYVDKINKVINYLKELRDEFKISPYYEEKAPNRGD